MGEYKTIGQKLRDARGERSVEQIAIDNGISASAVYMYENDQRVPRDEIKMRLARYFKTSVEALFFVPQQH